MFNKTETINELLEYWTWLIFVTPDVENLVRA